MPLPKLIVLEVPEGMSADSALEEVKGAVAVLGEQVTSPQRAEQFFKLADSARLVDLEAMKTEYDKDHCICGVCTAASGGYNACLEELAKGD